MLRTPASVDQDEEEHGDRDDRVLRALPDAEEQHDHRQQRDLGDRKSGVDQGLDDRANDRHESDGEAEDDSRHRPEHESDRDALQADRDMALHLTRAQQVAQGREDPGRG